MGQLLLQRRTSVRLVVDRYLTTVEMIDSNHLVSWFEATGGEWLSWSRLNRWLDGVYTTYYRGDLPLLILVSLLVVGKRTFTCVASDTDDGGSRLIRGFQLLHQGLSCCVVGELTALQVEISLCRHPLHECVDRIHAHPLSFVPDH